MKEKGISQYTLIKKYKVSPGQITRLKRNESVSTHTIDIFCKILDCQSLILWNTKKKIRTANTGRSNLSFHHFNFIN